MEGFKDGPPSTPDNVKTMFSHPGKQQPPALAKDDTCRSASNKAMSRGQPPLIAMFEGQPPIVAMSRGQPPIMVMYGGQPHIMPMS